MRAVTPTNIARRALDRFRTAAVVAALACASNGAYAAFASVLIDDFFLTATPGNATSALFAPTPMGQIWDLQTFHNLVQTDLETGSVANFSNVTATATGPQANATVSSSPITLPSGQITPSFHLAATATPLPGGGLYEATGLMFTFGSYCFYDEALDPTGAFDGTSAFCTGSGSVDFFLQYDLNVVRGIGDPPTSALADLAVNATNVLLPDQSIGSLSFYDFASTVAGIPSKLDQQLLWTASLGAGASAGFDLTGTVVVQAIPEPGILSLAALGLIGLAATRRRNVRAVS